MQNWQKEKRESIGFTITPCSLGLVLVAASRHGVCAVLIGEDEQTLRADLSQRFPDATVAAEAGLTRTAQEIVTVIDAPWRAHRIVLDVRGTDFQRRVWAALQAIPAGATRSYAEVASAIGAPTSSRAVAAACAANPIAVLIPCHRVVRGDGSLSGYRWGVERKRVFLAREQAPALERAA